jgi:hypothetical protein
MRLQVRRGRCERGAHHKYERERSQAVKTKFVKRGLRKDGPAERPAHGRRADARFEDKERAFVFRPAAAEFARRIGRISGETRSRHQSGRRRKWRNRHTFLHAFLYAADPVIMMYLQQCLTKTTRGTPDAKMERRASEHSFVLRSPPLLFVEQKPKAT